MSTETGSFKFTVPKDHPDAGEKSEPTFKYQKCSDDAGAIDVIRERVKKEKENDKDVTWSIVALVNARLFGNAKNNAYQNMLAMYKPSEASVESQHSALYRGMIRDKVSAEIAKAQIMAMFPDTTIFADNVESDESVATDA